MKKLFLIPLLACFLCVNMWGATVQVGTFQQLKDALDASVAGDVIELTDNIAYPASATTGNAINIKKSITLDGKEHHLTGYGIRANGNRCAIVINDGEESTIDFTIKNITI